MEPETRVQKKQKNRNMSQKFGTGSSRYLVARLTLEVYQTMVPKVNRLIPTSFSWIIHTLENHWKPSNIPNFLGCNQKPSAKKRSHEVNTIKTNLWNWFGPSWTVSAACAQTRIVAVKSRHVSKAFPPRFSVLMGTTSTSTERRLITPRFSWDTVKPMFSPNFRGEFRVTLVAFHADASSAVGLPSRVPPQMLLVFQAVVLPRGLNVIVRGPGRPFHPRCRGIFALELREVGLTAWAHARNSQAWTRKMLGCIPGFAYMYICIYANVYICLCILYIYTLFCGWHQSLKGLKVECDVHICCTLLWGHLWKGFIDTFSRNFCVKSPFLAHISRLKINPKYLQSKKNQHVFNHHIPVIRWMVAKSCTSWWMVYAII